MPNCNFFATPEDHASILDWLFAEGTCHVYESYSDMESPLKQFHSTEDVLDQFNRQYPNGEFWRSIYLQLYVLGAGPQFTVKRIELNPKACDGAKFRYAADGWGLVQLYLENLSDNRLNTSSTNHNSLKRAETWAPTIGGDSDLTGKYGPHTWDFKRITSFSSRLNRQIKKQSISTINNTLVLSGAQKLWEQGISLGSLSITKDF